MLQRRETPADIERRAFGRAPKLRSVALDSVGVDLVMEHGDIAFAAGGDNLAQDLKVALLTPTGSDPFNVAFGFDGLLALTDDHTPSLTEELLKLSIMKTVATDARITRVNAVTVTQAEPHVARRWTVDAEVQTVLGDVLELVLGEVDHGG